MLLSFILALVLQFPSSIQWDSKLSDDGKVVLVGTPEKGTDHISGTVTTISCSGNQCHSPEEYEFEFEIEVAEGGDDVMSSAPAPVKTVPAPAKAAPAKKAEVKAAETSESSESGSLWALIIEAILWGFAMLLTPCIFPMVPMTVSFFMKGSANKAQGRLKAFFYGLFIVLLYTVPICLIIGATWIFGGSAVTADIFNWLSTHWLPNIIFFIVFMVFAASFFGAFEIVLPSSWTNSADKNSDRKGLAGVFFLALTLVLVSFSCTGPIVSTVLIKSTQGEFWTPMVTMLAFSVAFALPFTLLAFFPSLLKNLPKSGGWLNSVKVVLGFIELALGLKFLSTADQTYHWGILDRPVYIAIWIVVFTLLGLYLLGKIKFRHDDELKYVSVTRLTLAIASLSFAVYLVPGMFGAPLKALSGYLPPMETQDFVLGAGSGVSAQGSASVQTETLDMDEALELARKEGKKVFVDITGYGCVNCREMEQRVWSDPRVGEIMAQDYVLLKLYVDDKAKLPESKWVTTDGGTVLKDVGRVNSHIALTRFNVNSQPNYFILDAEGNTLAGPYSYDLDVDKFVNFLLNN